MKNFTVDLRLRIAQDHSAEVPEEAPCDHAPDPTSFEQIPFDLESLPAEDEPNA